MLIQKQEWCSCTIGSHKNCSNPERLNPFHATGGLAKELWVSKVISSFSSLKTAS